MSQLDEQLKRMNEKWLQFLQRYQSLQKENERLKQEFRQVVERYNELESESQKWQQQIEILKFSQEQMSETEKKAFEKRLNQYVKEIDRCISLLKE